VPIARENSEAPPDCLCPDGLQFLPGTVLPVCPIPEHTASLGIQTPRGRDLVIAVAVVLAVLSFLLLAASKIPV